MPFVWVHITCLYISNVSSLGFCLFSFSRYPILTSFRFSLLLTVEKTLPAANRIQLKCSVGRTDVGSPLAAASRGEIKRRHRPTWPDHTESRPDSNKWSGGRSRRVPEWDTTASGLSAIQSGRASCCIFTPSCISFSTSTRTWTGRNGKRVLICRKCPSCTIIAELYTQSYDKNVEALIISYCF